jgi:hypothetical protein
MRKKDKKIKHELFMLWHIAMCIQSCKPTKPFMEAYIIIMNQYSSLAEGIPESFEWSTQWMEDWKSGKRPTCS